MVSSCCFLFSLRSGALFVGVISLGGLLVSMFFTGVSIWSSEHPPSDPRLAWPPSTPAGWPPAWSGPPSRDADRHPGKEDHQPFAEHPTALAEDLHPTARSLPPGVTPRAPATNVTGRPTHLPQPSDSSLWIRAEPAPLAVALVLQVAFSALTVLLLYGAHARRPRPVLLWLAPAAFGLVVATVGAALSARTSLDAATARGFLHAAAHLVGCGLLWYGWAVVLAYHRQLRGPPQEYGKPHFTV